MKIKKQQLSVFLVSLTALHTGPAADIASADMCQAMRLKETAKYASCRLKTDAKAASTESSSDYSKCDSKFALKMLRLEEKTAGDCTADVALDFMHASLSDLADAGRGGGTAAYCGNGVADGNEQCDGADLGGATCASLGYSIGGDLSCGPGCAFDTGLCSSQQMPATGQVQSAGPGSDGEVQAGAPLAYEDNGDGTITDLNTGLVWEKKDDSSGVHGFRNKYTWGLYDSDYGLDGTLATEFLDTLNNRCDGDESTPCTVNTDCEGIGNGLCGHAGRRDWRIPSYKELVSLLDLDYPYYSRIHEIFDQGANGCFGCEDVTQPSCSCTAWWQQWTNTVDVGSVTGAGFGDVYVVNFESGVTWMSDIGATTNSARAVRGGLW